MREEEVKVKGEGGGGGRREQRERKIQRLAIAHQIIICRANFCWMQLTVTGPNLCVCPWSGQYLHGQGENSI